MFNTLTNFSALVKVKPCNSVAKTELYATRADLNYKIKI